MPAIGVQPMPTEAKSRGPSPSDSTTSPNGGLTYRISPPCTCVCRYWDTSPAGASPGVPGRRSAATRFTEICSPPSGCPDRLY